MVIRYMILSPSEEARQAFLGGLFGTFELSPRGHGERVSLQVEGGGLEIVGTGQPGRLEEMTRKLVKGGVHIDGILFLIPPGDEESWNEVRSVTRWIQGEELPIVLKTWVFNSLNDLDKETNRRSILTLVKEQLENSFP